MTDASPTRASGVAGLGSIVPMVLAAGHATRLRPLTSSRAKAVVPFLNRPLLDYTLDWLARCGFRRVVINLHHAPDTIVGRYGSQGFGLRIDYSHEPRLLGTAGGPRRAIDLLDEHVLLVNGDVLTLAALGPLVRRHLRSGAPATLGLFRGTTGRGYPQVAATEDGALAGFPGGPSAPGSANVRGVFCGVHLLRRETLEMIPPDTFAGTVDHLYRPLLAAGVELGAVPLSGCWYEVGDPDRYIEHQLEALRCGSAPLAVEPRERSLHAGYVALDGHLETTRLCPPFLVGAGARVQDGARVEATVLADRARVSRGARLTECVVWQDAIVGPGASLNRCVVMDGVRVPPRTVASRKVFTAAGPVEFDTGTAGS